MEFKTIWNCREHFENNVFKACALKVFEAIWNFRKIIENNVSKVCIIALFETIWIIVGKIWKHENMDAYVCNMTRFDTIFWLAEIILKAMKLNGAFWRGSDSATDPYCKFGRFIFLIFLDEV